MSMYVWLSVECVFMCVSPCMCPYSYDIRHTCVFESMCKITCVDRHSQSGGAWIVGVTP